jgi:hypothetical protein
MANSAEKDRATKLRYCQSATEVTYFSKIYYHSTLQDPILNGVTGISPPPRDLISDHKKLKWKRVQVAFKDITFIPNFVKVGEVVQKLKLGHKKACAESLEVS